MTRVVGADDRTIESLLGAAAPDPGHLQQPGLLLLRQYEKNCRHLSKTKIRPKIQRKQRALAPNISSLRTNTVSTKPDFSQDAGRDTGPIWPRPIIAGDSLPMLPTRNLPSAF